jgi:hypothetical protein
MVPQCRQQKWACLQAIDITTFVVFGGTNMWQENKQILTLMQKVIGPAATVSLTPIQDGLQQVQKHCP